MCWCVALLDRNWCIFAFKPILLGHLKVIDINRNFFLAFLVSEEYGELLQIAKSPFYQLFDSSRT